MRALDAEALLFLFSLLFLHSIRCSIPESRSLCPLALSSRLGLPPSPSPAVGGGGAAHAAWNQGKTGMRNMSQMTEGGRRSFFNPCLALRKKVNRARAGRHCQRWLLLPPTRYCLFNVLALYARSSVDGFLNRSSDSLLSTVYTQIIATRLPTRFLRRLQAAGPKWGSS